MRERRERGSLWGVQRRTGPEGGDDAVHDSDASPKAQHLLDLQRSAGNTAVTGAVVQRSIWEDWFGGGDAAATSLKAGPQQQDAGGMKATDQGSIKGGGMQPTILEPGLIKGGGAQPGSIKGGGASTILGEGGSIFGAKGYPNEAPAEQSDYKDVEAKGYEGYDGYDGSNQVSDEMAGSKDVEAKGYEGYADEASPQQEEYKDGGSSWGDGPASPEEQAFKDDISGGPAIN